MASAGCLLLRSVSEISLREKRIEEKKCISGGSNCKIFHIRFFHSTFSLAPEDFLGGGFLNLIADTGREEGGFLYKVCS